MSPEQFLDIADLFPDAALLLTASGTILAANPAVANQLGVGPDELQGKALAEFCTTPPDALAQYLRDCSRSRQKVIGSLTIRREDGQLVSCVAQGKVVQPRSDSAEAVVLLRLVPREAAVSQFLLLNQRVMDLSREISRRQQAEEALRESARRKDDWIAMLAHELRGPLNPISNGVKVLQLEGVPEPDLRRARDLIARQIEHLARLVNDLLDVTRITRGQMRLHPERVDWAKLVRTTVEDYRPTMEQSGLTLSLQIPETPLWLKGDTTRLTQVLSNLLDNARKFTGAPGRVEVRLEAKAEERLATLYVRDTGEGIEPEMLPRLFEPLNQADRSLDRTKGGLGLGLALVKGLAELHGGAVEVRSGGRGCGAEFIVRLPQVEEPAALSDAPKAGSGATKTKKVLVIEDNKDAADSLRMLLEALGHAVKVAYSGLEGLRAAGQWYPDIIFSDIGLPGLDGFAVARELRRNPATAGAKLIALTGYGTEEDQRQGRDSGFDHFLTKPAAPTKIMELVA